MSNYTKYIIEIADEPVDGRYPVKGFTTFAFTEESLKKLEKLDEKVEEKAVKVYYYITDDFDIWLTRDDGEEVDMARKEAGNYFASCEKAEHVRDRMLKFLGKGEKDDTI